MNGLFEGLEYADFLKEVVMVLEKPMGIWLLLAFTCQVVLLAATHPLQAAGIDRHAANEAKQLESSNTETPEGVPAVAVYYAKRYHGKRTHSGEAYNEQRLSAAHPTLPHGTKVKVVNLANNRSVLVTINDRCRQRSFELIDLSRAAASKLGFLGKGKAQVRIIPLPKE